jgi:DNA helicase II / ATP-dependent DNA helicase PcrA
MISSALLQALNEEQRAAVLHPSGPALVIAGAGSGKTRVLTYRIAHLIASNVPARQILAVTFTNKAAEEMKRRVESLCTPQPDLWIGTFHAMCARLLRVEITGLGMQPNFSIVDSQDSLTVIKEVLRHLQ